MASWQRLAENWNQRSASLYDPDFKAGLQLWENAVAGTIKLVTVTRALADGGWEPYRPGAKDGKGGSGEWRAVWSSEELGKAAAALGAHLADAPAPGVAHVLLLLASTQREDLITQRAFTRHLDNRVVVPFRAWLGRDDAFRVALEKMEVARLRMDYAIYKAAQAKGDHDPRKVRAETTVRAHKDAMLATQVYIDAFQEEQSTLHNTLHTLISLQRIRHEKAAEEANTAIRHFAAIDAAFFKP